MNEQGNEAGIGAKAQKLRCKIITKDGREFGPFDTHEEVRACVARELPGEPEDDSETDVPNGWKVVSVWPPKS